MTLYPITKILFNKMKCVNFKLWKKYPAIYSVKFISANRFLNELMPFFKSVSFCMKLEITQSLNFYYFVRVTSKYHKLTGKFANF